MSPTTPSPPMPLPSMPPMPHWRLCRLFHLEEGGGRGQPGEGEANAFGGREGLGHRLAAAWVCVCEGGVRRPGSYVLRETIRVRPAAFSGVRFFTLSYLPLPCSRTHFLARKGFTLTTFSGAREGVLETVAAVKTRRRHVSYPGTGPGSRHGLGAQPGIRSFADPCNGFQPG